MSDDQKFEALKKGSKTVFESVYKENREKFIGFAIRYGVNDAEAIDLYQDAFLAFHDNIKQQKITELTSAISTYLFSIGKYLILNHLRKVKKDLRTDQIDQFNTHPNLVDVDHLDFEEDSLSIQQNILKKFFNTLGKKCKEILTMFYYEGLTISEIKEIGQYNSENVVKSNKSRCLKTLKENIKNAR